ncbi:hypothetical protein D3C80_1849860 [compost metagenome]
MLFRFQYGGWSSSTGYFSAKLLPSGFHRPVLLFAAASTQRLPASLYSGYQQGRALKASRSSCNWSEEPTGSIHAPPDRRRTRRTAGM